MVYILTQRTSHSSIYDELHALPVSYCLIKPFYLFVELVFALRVGFNKKKKSVKYFITVGSDSNERVKSIKYIWLFHI